VPLEIRARIALQVDKFTANAKKAGASFRLIASTVKSTTKEIDSYIEKSANNRLRQAQRTDAQEIQSARERAKAISKIEIERVRNTGGIRPGTNVGRNLGLEAKNAAAHEGRIAAMARMSAREREKYERNLAKEFRKLQRDKEKASREFTRGAQRDTANYNKWLSNEHRKSSREYVNFWRRSLKEKEAAEKQSNMVSQRASREYVNWWKQALKEREKEEKRVAKAQPTLDMAKFFNTQEFMQRAAVMRHAIGDISRRVMAMGTSFAAAFGLAVKAAADFESAFTSVERTSQLIGVEAEGLRKNLLKMSTEIPVAFNEITKVATLGAQLGIAAKDLDGFTEAVIKFASLSGLSADQVGLSFGRLAQLMRVPISEIENLSSAIAFAGINAVATDREILAMGESIAAAANLAGFSADQTLGFATALASLKVRPEEARGVFVRLFRTFDIEAGKAGARMDDLARVVGATKDEAIAMLKQDPSQFFQRFLKGAQATGKLNETMRALGITNSRELNVLIRLANNMDVVEKSLRNTSDAFEEGTFATEAFGLVVDDLNSKFIMLKNSAEALGADFGDLVGGPIGVAADLLKELTENIRSSPAELKLLIGILGGLVTAFFLVGGAIGLSIAGLLALKIAFNSVAREGIKMGLGLSTLRALLISIIPGAAASGGVMKGLAGSFVAVTTGATGASAAMRLFTASIPVVGLLLTVLSVAAIGFGEVSRSADKAKDSFLEAAGGAEKVAEAITKDTMAGEGIEQTVVQLEKLTDAQKKSRLESANARLEASKEAEARLEVERAFLSSEEAIKKNAEAMKKQKVETEKARVAIQELNGEVESSTVLFGENTVAVLLNALSKNKLKSLGDKTVISAYGQISNESRKTLEKFGIGINDIIAMSLDEGVDSDVVVRSITDALKKLNKSGDINAAKNELAKISKDFNLDLKIDTEALKEVAASNINFNQLGNRVRQLTGAVNEQVDGLREVATEAEIMEGALQALGPVIGDVDGDVIDLNDALKELIASFTSQDIAEGRIASALDTFAQAAQETGGELFGLGEAARTNLSNFASFMDAAAEASIAAGEGTDGAVRRIIGGLYALEDAGIDTGDAFKKAGTLIIDSLESTIPGIRDMFTLLGSPQSMRGVEDAIRALYAAKIAAADTPNDVARLRRELEASLAMIAGFGSSFSVNMGRVSRDSGKAQTALEKLQETLAGVFKWINTTISVQNSIGALGKALEENGRTFSAWSEDGRKNVGALLSTIDTLAAKSGGNLQTFANDLASLRQALVQMGVPASGLRYIDDALAKIGKTGKASSRDVNRFMGELKNTGEAERAILRLANAVSKLQSEIRAGLSANFAQQRAIDDITLGWLDMADAAETAREAIEGAQKAIRDAKQAIDDARASIAGLTADKNKLEYQLQIAVKYGDTLRANQLRADIAKIDADIAKEQDKISDSQESIAKSYEEIRKAESALGINPGTRDIINRNRALEDMAARYGDVAAAMLLNAKPGDDLNKIIDDQIKAFTDNAVQMGYTQKEAEDMAKVLREELIVAMNNIPKDIKTLITAETDGALRAVNSFASQATARLNSIPRHIQTVHTNVIRTVNETVPQAGVAPVPHHLGFARFATGGFVSGPGTSTSDSIAARLSAGEYVVSAAAVQRYGVDLFDSLNQMRAAPARMSVGSGAAATGEQMVYLSPEDRQLLRAAIDRPIELYTDNATIARSANAGNQVLAQRGMN